MTARRSIEVPGFSHGKQPIPAASRVGNIVMTGGIYGLDPETGLIPDDVGQQAELMFENLQRIVEAAGAGLERIVKMTVYVKVPEARDAVNKHWLVAFPDPASRPARHTFQNDHLPANMLVQCDVIAVLDGA
ncbi:RidA family protein [Bradyrhizobium jicamae]|uniref:RidA family protein n=1 Tax=Bradyrhizobium jicamae TaxID=280332 RepID=UPI001BAD4EB8|nr:RidA family protein [Bradyrhizobium jicamae]MBR0754323.1 RidA family protein [Bradyrhizobium jicamae]